MQKRYCANVFKQTDKVNISNDMDKNSSESFSDDSNLYQRRDY